MFQQYKSIFTLIIILGLVLLINSCSPRLKLKKINNNPGFEAKSQKFKINRDRSILSLVTFTKEYTYKFENSSTNEDYIYEVNGKWEVDENTIKGSLFKEEKLYRYPLKLEIRSLNWGRNYEVISSIEVSGHPTHFKITDTGNLLGTITLGEPGKNIFKVAMNKNLYIIEHEAWFNDIYFSVELNDSLFVLAEILIDGINSLLEHIAPAIASFLPFMNLVIEYTTISAPNKNGDRIIGVNVLSTTNFASYFLAISLSFGMLETCNIGLVTLSV